MVPQSAALKKQRHSSSPNKKPTEKRVVAHYLGLDLHSSTSSSKIPSWAAVSISSLLQYRPNLTMVLKSCYNKVARRDWLDLMCAMEEASAALGDALIRPKVLLKKIKEEEKAAAAAKKKEKEEEEEEMKLSHTPEYFDDWKSGSMGTQSQSQLTMSQGGARFSQGVISLLEENDDDEKKKEDSKDVQKNGEVAMKQNEKERKEGDNDEKQNDKTVENPSSKPSEKIHKEQEKEGQKKDSVPTSATATVANGLTASGTSNPTVVGGVLRPPRLAILSQTTTTTTTSSQTNVEKKSVSIRATPEKIPPKRENNEGGDDGFFTASSSNKMGGKNVGFAASALNKGGMDVETTTSSAPVDSLQTKNDPSSVPGKDEISNDMSVKEKACVDKNNVLGGGANDDVLRANSSISKPAPESTTEKPQINEDASAARDGDDIEDACSEPTPSQNNAAEVLLQIAIPTSSSKEGAPTSDEMESNEVTMSTSKYVEAVNACVEPTPSQNNAADALLQIGGDKNMDAMIGKDKNEIVEENDVDEKIDVDTFVSDQKEKGKTSVCTSPLPPKMCLQKGDRGNTAAENNEKGCGTTRVISTPVPSHRKNDLCDVSSVSKCGFGKPTVTPSPHAAAASHALSVSVVPASSFCADNDCAAVTPPPQKEDCGSKEAAVGAMTLNGGNMAGGEDKDVLQAKKLHFTTEEDDEKIKQENGRNMSKDQGEPKNMEQTSFGKYQDSTVEKQPTNDATNIHPSKDLKKKDILTVQKNDEPNSCEHDAQKETNLSSNKNDEGASPKLSSQGSSGGGLLTQP